MRRLHGWSPVFYALIATATDYDCWRASEAPVTVAEVFRTLQENVNRSHKITTTILEELNDLVVRGEALTSAEGGMQYSLVTQKWSEEDGAKLAYILRKDFEKKILVDVISSNGFKPVSGTVNPETPWSFPSSSTAISELPSKTRLAFLARPGVAYSILASAVPARTNIAALKSLGVKVVVAFSTFSTIHIAHTYLNYKVSRIGFEAHDHILCRSSIASIVCVPGSFFEGTAIVAHAKSWDPFNNQLTNALVSMVETPSNHSPDQPHLFLSTDWSCMRSYALIATPTNHDCWRVNEAVVTVEEVDCMLQVNADQSREVIATILQELDELATRKVAFTSTEGGMECPMNMYGTAKACVVL
ncbi:hypothetical protein BDV93DRAFT_563333 [Ceratobasidium sp. AG-I]|nr:hypothetical protein BDV93DRAFT_563333 [Ceratobasidium sp. AG-I]